MQLCWGFPGERTEYGQAVLSILHRNTQNDPRKPDLSSGWLINRLGDGGGWGNSKLRARKGPTGRQGQAGLLTPARAHMHLASGPQPQPPMISSSNTRPTAESSRASKWSETASCLRLPQPQELGEGLWPAEVGGGLSPLTQGLGHPGAPSTRGGLAQGPGFGAAPREEAGGADRKGWDQPKWLGSRASRFFLFI